VMKEDTMQRLDRLRAELQAELRQDADRVRLSMYAATFAGALSLLLPVLAVLIWM
jgi:hypothetical protein